MALELDPGIRTKGAGGAAGGGGVLPGGNMANPPAGGGVPRTGTQPAQPSIAGGNVDITAAADQQLEDIRAKQAGYTQQLQTNTTKAANVGRLNRADALSAQKEAAKRAAMQAGRQWTAADEMEWADRSARFQQQAENEMLLGREATIGASIGAELNPVQAQINQQLAQKGQALDALKFGESATMSRAAMDDERSYRAAMLKVQQQQLALQQAKQLEGAMYGPFGPGGNSQFQPTRPGVAPPERPYASDGNNSGFYASTSAGGRRSTVEAPRGAYL